MSVHAMRCWKFDSWFGYAALCLFLGQVDEYRRIRYALLERFGATTDPIIAARGSCNWDQSPVRNQELWICHLDRREAEALMLPNLARNSIWNGPVW